MIASHVTFLFKPDSLLSPAASASFPISQFRPMPHAAATTAAVSTASSKRSRKNSEGEVSSSYFNPSPLISLSRSIFGSDLAINPRFEPASEQE